MDTRDMRGKRVGLAVPLLASAMILIGGGSGTGPADAVVASSVTDSTEIAAADVRNGRLMVVADVARRERDWFIDFYPDGSHIRRVSTADLELFGVEYSPDGGSLLVFADSNDELTQAKIFRARSDGSRLRRLTSGPNDWTPTWSPNGRRVAFVHLYELILMRADGTRRRGIFPTSQLESVTWAADGRLVFGSWFDFEHTDFMDRPDLWSVRPDGTDLKRLTDTDDVAEYAPAPSPDANLIAYEHRSDGGGPITVHVMDADGTNDRELTEGASPEWSPDGEWVAHSTITAESYSAIRIVRLDGTDSRIVELDDGIADAPPWRAKLTFSWQPWPGTALSHLRGFRFRVDGGHTVFTGRVDPSLPGHRVQATLRSTAEGRVVAVRDVLTDSDGRFRFRLPRSGRTSSEVTVRYTGDRRHLPSRRTVMVPR